MSLRCRVKCGDASDVQVKFADVSDVPGEMW